MSLVEISNYLIADKKRTFIIVFLCSLLSLLFPPGMILVSIFLAFATLARGNQFGFIVLLAAIMPLILIFLDRSLSLYVLLMLSRFALIWGFAVILNQYRSWRLLIELAIVLGILVVLSIHLTIPDTNKWWIHVLSLYMHQLSGLIGSLSNEDVREKIKQLAPMATGLAFVGIMIGIFTQLMLARWWQGRLSKTNLLKSEFVQIRMGLLFTIIFTIVLVGLWFNQDLAMDLFPVVFAPFVLAGLSFLHSFLGIYKYFLYVLIIAYVGLFFMQMWIIALLGLMGYIDSYYDFRSKIPRQAMGNKF